MTISLNWVMALPANISADQFDSWYLGTHTKYGKASAHILRYVVNRAYAIQPRATVGNVYRIAQEYWQDWEHFEACWNSPSGHAVLGDGLVNIGLDPATIPGIAISHDVQFEVANPANFSSIRRGYRGSSDGSITKLLVYGMTRNKDVGRWYADRFHALGHNPLIREHVFGTSLGRSLKIGYLSALPGPGQMSYDWLLELWFDDVRSADTFLGNDQAAELWSTLAQEMEISASALCRGQEMLVIAEPTAHAEP